MNYVRWCVGAAFLIWLMVGLGISKVSGCEYRFCRDRVTVTKTSPITNMRRQRVGDLYNPGHGRRIQIRDNRRRIIGYIEADGDVTDTRRRKIGESK